MVAKSIVQPYTPIIILKNKMKTLLTLFLLVLILVTTSCSTSSRVIQITKNRKPLLLEAGFKPLQITTQEQRQQMEKLTTNKITTLSRNGKAYFIYPDLEHDQVLVGRNRQYMHYNQLVTEKLAGPAKADKKLEQFWARSGVWDNMGGMSNVNLEDPFFLSY
ncbi:MAG: hypothetical protein ACH346_04175 [Chthoniobacterales bacterium]